MNISDQELKVLINKVLQEIEDKKNGKCVSEECKIENKNVELNRILCYNAYKK